MLITNEIFNGIFTIEDSTVRMYLITGKDRALLLDTGFGDDSLCDVIQSLYGGPITLAHTHGHPDHIGGDRNFSQILAHRADWKEIIDITHIEKSALKELREGDRISLGDRDIEVLEVPGHTPGSLAFFDRKRRLLFVGDYVSDKTVYLCMPGASAHLYCDSIARMISMKRLYDVLLGCHGQAMQTVSQARQLFSCAMLMKCGKLKGVAEEAYDGRYFKKYSYGSASIYGFDKY